MQLARYHGCVRAHARRNDENPGRLHEVEARDPGPALPDSGVIRTSEWSERVRRISMVVFVLAVTVAAAGPGCSSSDALPKAPPGSAAAAPAAAKKLTLLPAPGGDVATAVARHAAKAEHEGGKLLVYVGATWCEPCQEFHKAAEEGKLDATFPGLTLMVFDADLDGERLAVAGYRSNLVPLFVRPSSDGTSSQRWQTSRRACKSSCADARTADLTKRSVGHRREGAWYPARGGYAQMGSFSTSSPPRRRTIDGMQGSRRRR
jgi:hypothetical protein